MGLEQRIERLGIGVGLADERCTNCPSSSAFSPVSGWTRTTGCRVS